MNTIEIEGVSKTFGNVTAVDDLSLCVPQGSVYGFIGPNGAGKTTTIRMVMRIFHPDCGQIRVFGEGHSETATDRIGYLPEERGLYKKMKVNEILKFYAKLKGLRSPQEEIDEWLERMNLSEWKNKKVETLSKGMSQKLQFIAAVVSKPELVILDEPFSGLDPVNTEVIREAVLNLKRQGTTVIFSTHDMNVAEMMCDYIFMIFKGKKVLDGTLEEIQSSYSSDSIRLRMEGNSLDLNSIPDVERIADFGHYQEIRLRDGANPQNFLADIVPKTNIQRFELTRPSLEDIFIRIAGPAAEELEHV